MIGPLANVLMVYWLDPCSTGIAMQGLQLFIVYSFYLLSLLHSTSLSYDAHPQATLNDQKLPNDVSVIFSKAQRDPSSPKYSGLVKSILHYDKLIDELKVAQAVNVKAYSSEAAKESEEVAKEETRLLEQSIEELTIEDPEERQKKIELLRKESSKRRIAKTDLIFKRRKQTIDGETIDFNHKLAPLKNERTKLVEQLAHIFTSSRKINEIAFFKREKGFLKKAWEFSGMTYEKTKVHILDRLRLTKEYAATLDNPSQQAFFERNIVGKYEGIFKVLGDGDCFYRSLILGILHHLHKDFQLDFGLHLINVLKPYTRYAESIKGVRTDKPDSTATFIRNSKIFNPVAKAAEFFTNIIRYHKYLKFETLYELCMDDYDVSHALVYLFRVMASDAWKTHYERKVDYDTNFFVMEPTAEELAKVTKLYEYAEMPDYLALADVLQVHLNVYQFGEDQPAVIPPEEIARPKWSPTISILFSNNHYDLFLDEISYEQEKLMGKQDNADKDYQLELAKQFGQ